MPTAADTPIDRLLQIMARLRDPADGCPWDREQDFHSIAPYTIEEAYEVADAIQRDDRDDLREELGDLLFQVVYHARMAEEAGWFDFQDVVNGIAEKLVRRHPHVFADASVDSAGDQSLAWEQFKDEERSARNAGAGVLDGIPVSLPGLVRAVKLQKRAARVGFDWATWHGPLDKLREELAELEAELQRPSHDGGAIQDETGDLLFSCCNLARHLGIDPEAAARRANSKFETRFRRMELDIAGSGLAMADMTLAELEACWLAAKQETG